jgi:hypothetical protein
MPGLSARLYSLREGKSPANRTGEHRHSITRRLSIQLRLQKIAVMCGPT